MRSYSSKAYVIFCLTITTLLSVLALTFFTSTTISSIKNENYITSLLLFILILTTITVFYILYKRFAYQTAVTISVDSIKEIVFIDTLMGRKTYYFKKFDNVKKTNSQFIVSISGYNKKTIYYVPFGSMSSYAKIYLEAFEYKNSNTKIYQET